MASTQVHKCRPPKVAVTVACQCGWQSTEWVGKGARANAYGEWRAHVANPEHRRPIVVNIAERAHDLRFIP